MNTHILKYPFDQTHTAFPEGAEILKVGMQHGVLTVWALVDPKAGTLYPAIYGTGEQAQEGSRHLFTFFEGGYVWHVFEPNMDPLEQSTLLKFHR